MTGAQERLGCRFPKGRSCAYPRIKHGLKDIGEQIEQHIAGCHDQHAALHKQDVAGRNCLHKHGADTGPLKHRLDIDRTAQHEACLNADDGMTLTRAARKAWP